jgi:hypothetical protein
MFNPLSKPMKCKSQSQFNSNLTKTYHNFFFLQFFRTKRQIKIDKVFFRTPKLELHIALNV